jgi:hypothetical protein
MPLRARQRPTRKIPGDRPTCVVIVDSVTVWVGTRHEDTAAALRDLVDLADGFPGAFKPDFELGYWAGVAEGSERWHVRFEGDIRDNEFTVLGHSAAEAPRSAVREAQARIP